MNNKEKIEVWAMALKDTEGTKHNDFIMDKVKKEIPFLMESIEARVEELKKEDLKMKKVKCIIVEEINGKEVSRQEFERFVFSGIKGDTKDDVLQIVNNLKGFELIGLVMGLKDVLGKMLIDDIKGDK